MVDLRRRRPVRARLDSLHLARMALSGLFPPPFSGSFSLDSTRRQTYYFADGAGSYPMRTKFRRGLDHGGVSPCQSLLLFGALLFLATCSWAESLADGPPTLLVTPSTTTLALDGLFRFSAVDGTGRPASNVGWSISAPIADLRDDNGMVLLVGRKAGRGLLTATANGQSASAPVVVIGEKQLPPATATWPLEPMAGFQSLHVRPAAPAARPEFYSIEWKPSTHVIVRALSASGQQLWLTHLTCMASPATLQHRMPAPGQVFLNEALVNSNSMFILGQKNAFLATNSHDPSAYGLPIDGQFILVRTSSDSAGGMIYLERGRFRDSLGDLSPADGNEAWRYRSAGRLAEEWTVNPQGTIGIVETLSNPPSSALLILDGTTGQSRFRIPFPISSSTLDGFRCTDPQRNVLKSLRPAVSGAVMSSIDGNMYVQVETHVESLLVEACTSKRYTFDDTLTLLRVSSDGEPTWKPFQHVHAEGDGDMVAQSRVFAGETIPDGFGGVLAAWTHISPDNSGGKDRNEARLSRIDPSGQRDFTLPIHYWRKDLNASFDENMVLGEGNVALYAINGPLLLRFDTQAGELSWVRQPPTGEVKLLFSTANGGVLVAKPVGNLIANV